jgi:tetratricopeptide (TPR) repeat protein
MTTSEFQRVRDVFHRVCALAPAERASALAELCDGNAKLRAEVESLLDEDSRNSSDAPFSRSQLARNLVTNAPRDYGPVPNRIGRYEILRAIGAGGMGVVYEARQDRPSRTVALKVMRPGTISPSLLRRFEKESELLARLQHPGIAQIFDAGAVSMEGGTRPFFAMELIRGVPLNEFVAARRLGTRDCLELFAQVCDAVEHAHQRGVIHRDLKPGNILVDTAGQPKVLDFGIARATDSDILLTTLQTDVGQLLGTLPYMSPEQVAGQTDRIDVRSDVYSLGVVLYELMAARLPHDVSHRSLPDAASIIRDAEPTHLSSIDSRFRGDIETIVAKALEKDPSRRYQSVGALAADIRRHLADQPIVARPASAIYQLRKFARRHKATTAATIGIALAMAGATIFSSIYAVRTERAREEAQRQADIAAAINQFLNEDLLASVAPGASRDAGRGRDVRMSDVLTEAARRIESACAPGGAFENKPEVEASIRATLARTLIRLGDVEAAYPHSARAFELRKSCLGEEHVDTLKAAIGLGGNLYLRNRLDEAAAVFERTLEVGRRALGPDDLLMLTCEFNYANVFWKERRFDEALKLMNHVYDSRREALGPDHNETIAARQKIAMIYKVTRRYDDAESIERECWAHDKVALGNDHPATLQVAHNLGTTLYYGNKYAEAEKIWRDVLEKRRRVLGPDHYETLTTCLNLGSALVEQGRPADAEPIYRQGHDAAVARYGEKHEKSLSFAFGLANALRDLHRFEDAEPLYQNAIRAGEASDGLTHPDTIQVLVGLFDMRMMQDRGAEAEQILARPVAALQEAGKLAENGRCVKPLIECRLKLGMRKAALQLARTYVDALSTVYGRESTEAEQGRELLIEAEQWPRKSVIDLSKS